MHRTTIRAALRDIASGIRSRVRVGLGLDPADWYARLWAWIELALIVGVVLPFAAFYVPLDAARHALWRLLVRLL